MGKKKKPFIDKKSAHSFKVVHRSQRDPLQADEESSKHVLVPADPVHEAKASVDTSDKRKAEQRKFGVFFDDDYDYLQHLKERGDSSHHVLPDELNESDADQFKLPQDVFASKYEEDVGLLNRAAPLSGPQLDLDPDIVAALDSTDCSVNPEDLLEDDFVAMANKDDLSECNDEKEERNRRLASFLRYESANDVVVSDDEDEVDDQSEIDDEFTLKEDVGHSLNLSGDDMKSRFTEYSLTSSVMKRNEGMPCSCQRTRLIIIW
jgi:protein LTV1